MFSFVKVWFSTSLGGKSDFVKKIVYDLSFSPMTGMMLTFVHRRRMNSRSSALKMLLKIKEDEDKIIINQQTQKRMTRGMNSRPSALICLNSKINVKTK